MRGSVVPSFVSRQIGRFRRGEAGAVAIEFVLIAPLLLTLLFGILTMGYYIGISHSVQQLASGAARASVVGLDETERTEIANEYLSEAGSRYPLLITDSVSSSISFDGSDPVGITVNVVYATDESFLDIANGFLGLDLGDIDRSAYLGY